MRNDHGRAQEEALPHPRATGLSLLAGPAPCPRTAPRSGGSVPLCPAPSSAPPLREPQVGLRRSGEASGLHPSTPEDAGGQSHVARTWGSCSSPRTPGPACGRATQGRASSSGCFHGRPSPRAPLWAAPWPQRPHWPLGLWAEATSRPPSSAQNRAEHARLVNEGSCSLARVRLACARTTWLTKKIRAPEPGPRPAQSGPLGTAEDRPFAPDAPSPGPSACRAGEAAAR